jgi:hypothetical protein
MAKVDPAYNGFTGYPSEPPTARVTFEGESTLSGKYYAISNGFIPAPDQRVWMIPIGTTYLIAGAVNAQTSQGFWQDLAGADYGVELGGGSYFDATDGLVLTGDMSTAGDVDAGNMLRHGPRNNRVPEIQFGSVAANGPGAGSSITSANINFSPSYPVGAFVYVLCSIVGAPAGTGQAMVRPTSITNVKFNALILKSDAARANFLAGENFTVHWMAMSRPADVT